MGSKQRWGDRPHFLLCLFTPAVPPHASLCQCCQMGWAELSDHVGSQEEEGSDSSSQAQGRDSILHPEEEFVMLPGLNGLKAGSSLPFRLLTSGLLMSFHGALGS